jgi:hypothetical protein
MKLYAMALMTGMRSSGGTKSWQPWGRGGGESEREGDGSHCES